jgi:hypothetical protein
MTYFYTQNTLFLLLLLFHEIFNLFHKKNLQNLENSKIEKHTFHVKKIRNSLKTFLKFFFEKL